MMAGRWAADRNYSLIHEAARKAGRFQAVALAHLDRPCPDLLERALRDLREALAGLDALQGPGRK